MFKFEPEYRAHVFNGSAHVAVTLVCASVQQAFDFAMELVAGAAAVTHVYVCERYGAPLFEVQI